MARLRVPRGVLDDVYRHAREGAPREVCGLLAGTIGPPRGARGQGPGAKGQGADAAARAVVRAFPIPNVHPRPLGEYQLDPAEQLRVTLLVEDELRLDVVGFYHSHPAGPARLSATDAARASWPDASYFLVHLKPTQGHLSARWDDDARRFVDEEVVLY